MLSLHKLNLGFGRRLPLVLQAEATECALSCLVMIAAYFGYRTDLLTMRRRFPVSLKGATLAGLMQLAQQLDLAARPLKLDIENIHKLRLPCILHWEFNHFVVLKSVNAKGITIHDPARGAQTLLWHEVSRCFTGVALELWPTTSFQPKAERQRIGLRALMGKVHGMFSSGTQVLALAVALEAFALLSPFFLQWVIDNAIVSADRNLLATIAVGFGLLMLMQQVLIAIRSWVLLYIGSTLNLQWRTNVFSHMIRLPVQFFEKRHLGDVISRFGATDAIERTLTTSFFEAILDGLMTVMTLIIMFAYSPLLAAVAACAMLLYAFGRWIWYKPLRHANEEQIIHAARQESHLLETVRGVKAIKLFSRVEARSASWLNLVVDQINAELRMEKLVLSYRLLNGVLFGVENILIIWLGAHLVIDGNFTVGVLTAFVAYKGQFDSRVSGLIDKFFEVKMLRLQAERLADIVLTEPEAVHNSAATASNNALEPSIAVTALRYRYSDLEPYILDGVTFEIPAGSSVAIVGPSGCGKTTLLNVLLGILPASEGEILIGGIPIKHLGFDEFRCMVGTVLQDDVLFAGTISENISFFDSNSDHAWVVQCAEYAAIASDIGQMPMGYNTLIGDMGTVLSGGQKQRVLLARALYKRPRILFLDEATSSLDIANEKQVNESVKLLNMTRVIIAHRPETIASASHVIFLEGGRIHLNAPMTASKMEQNGSEPNFIDSHPQSQSVTLLP